MRQTSIAMPKSVYIAAERSVYSGCKRPPQVQLASASCGMQGFLAQRAPAQAVRSHAGALAC